MSFKRFLILGGMSMLFLAGAAACNYPSPGAPTPFVFSTPDLTLTAIFNPGSQTTETAPALSPTQTNPPIQQNTPTGSVFIPSTTATQPPAPTNTPLPTNTPTQTPVPTAVSYAGPAVRSGPSLTASYLDEKPTLDGSFDEWTLDKYRIENVVAGAANWQNANDLSARLMLGWDENNLYLAARVLDDQYAQHAQGDQIFKGDSLEILIDTDVSGDYYLHALNGDDYQLGISPGSPNPGDNPQAYLWFPKGIAGGRQKVKVGAMRVDDGYRIEASIPWDTFGIDPSSGEHFGFAFSVSDNDKPGENVQQSMVSNVATRTLTDPTTWGDLTLSGSAPVSHGNAQVEALMTGTPPSLDGNLNEWTGGKFAVNHLVYDNDQWSGSSDLSGSLMAAWDSQYLYLGVKVIDNRYVQNATGENLFLGDSLEILFDRDLSGDFNQRSLSADDYQLGISPGKPLPGDHPEAYLWYPKAESGGKSTVKIASSSRADGYTVEIAVPWSLLDVSPTLGQHFGFAFSISDNDNANRNLQQSMVSTVATRMLADPTTWGDLVLTQ